MGNRKVVPFSRMSVDPEIQKLREALTSGEELYMDSEGTLIKTDEVDKSDKNDTLKAKTVPKAIVSL